MTHYLMTPKKTAKEKKNHKSSITRKRMTRNGKDMPHMAHRKEVVSMAVDSP